MTQALSDEERGAIAAATLAAALLIAQQVTARAVRDTLFLSAYQVRSLPLVMIGSAVVALLGAETLALALARRSPGRTLPAAALVSAVLLTLLFFVAAPLPRVAAVLVYLHVAAFGGALVSGFWSLVNERFDPYTARRVVGRIGTGATAGGVLGGVAAWAAADLVPVRGMLLVIAALHAAAAVAVLLSSSPERPAAAQQAPRLAPPPRHPSRSAWPSLRRAPYLRQLALVVFLGACVEAILDFGFKAETARRFAAGPALLGAFALFHAGISVASLVLQVIAARPALERLGIANTVALRPLLTALGSVAGAALPRFETAALARGVHDSLTHSLFRSGYELLYTPLPRLEKRRVKAIIDVAMDKAGTLAGSALVLLVIQLAASGAPRLLFVASALLSLAALEVSRRLQRGYVRTLELSLIDGRIEVDPADVLDRATRLTLAQTSLIQRGALLQEIEALRATLPASAASAPPAEASAEAPAVAAARAGDPLLEAVGALRSHDPQAVRRVLDAFPEPPPLLVAALVPLLASDRLFAEVLGPLRRSAPSATGQLVDALLDPATTPAVRRRIPRVLKVCPTPRAAAGLVAALDDASFEVRSSVAAALTALHEQGAVRIDREALITRVRRELDGGEPADRQLPLLFALLSLAIDRKPLQIVWALLRGGDLAPADRGLRGTALEYLSSVLPDDVFGRLVSVLGASSFRLRGPQRAPEQVAEELRASTVGLRLVDPPWKKPAED